MSVTGLNSWWKPSFFLFFRTLKPRSVICLFHFFDFLFSLLNECLYFVSYLHLPLSLSPPLPAPQECRLTVVVPLSKSYIVVSGPTRTHKHSNTHGHWHTPRYTCITFKTIIPEPFFFIALSTWCIHGLFYVACWRLCICWAYPYNMAILCMSPTYH